MTLDAIGQGNSGLVKKCFHVPTLSLVAVKYISIWDKGKRHQMIKELHAFEQNRSPFIVGFLGAFYQEGKFYFMQCILYILIHTIYIYIYIQ